MTNPHTGEFYIGRRKSRVSPEIDNYRGSSQTWYKLLSKEDIKSLDKEILEVFNSDEEMCLSEIDYITENIKNPLCKNSHIPGKGFYCKEHSPEVKERMKGKVLVRDEEGKVLRLDKDDERYINGILHGINKNKVIVRNKEGNSLSVDRNDERYINGDLIPVSKNMVTVINKEGKTVQVSKNDKNYLNGEYTHIAKGNTPWNKGNTPIEEYKDGVLIKVWPNLITLHEETKIPKSSIVNWINKRRNNNKGITYKYQK
jgi:hypothetical protein